MGLIRWGWLRRSAPRNDAGWRVAPGDATIGRGSGGHMKRLMALLAGAALAVAIAAPALAEDAKSCASPKQMEGFKTCADVPKAEEEGEVVIYSPDPEAAMQKVLAKFREAFPKIKTSYVRL